MDWRELLSRCCFRSVKCRLGQLRRVELAKLSFSGSFWTLQCSTGAGSARSGCLGRTSWVGPCSSGLFWCLALRLSVLGLGFLLSLRLMVGQKFWLSFWFHELTGCSGAGFLLSHQMSDFRLRSRKIWACFSKCSRWPCWVSAAWRLWPTKVQAIFETACCATLRSNWQRRTIPRRQQFCQTRLLSFWLALTSCLFQSCRNYDSNQVLSVFFVHLSTLLIRKHMKTT